jgi:hypothetical protein
MRVERTDPEGRVMGRYYTVAARVSCAPPPCLNKDVSARCIICLCKGHRCRDKQALSKQPKHNGLVESAAYRLWFFERFFVCCDLKEWILCRSPAETVTGRSSINSSRFDCLSQERVIPLALSEACFPMN